MKFSIDLLPILAAAAIYVVRIAEVRKRRQTIRGPVKENLTLKLFLLAGSLVFIGGLVEYVLLGWHWRLATLLLGLVCAVVSFSLRWRAIAALGRFWSLHVEIRENHEFVRTGPFAWMRHPVYFTMILELLAVALTLEAWWSLLGTMLVFIPTLIYRVRIEEQALVEKFGAAYREYQRTTPAMFPYKFPK